MKTLKNRLSGWSFLASDYIDNFGRLVTSWSKYSKIISHASFPSHIMDSLLAHPLLKYLDIENLYAPLITEISSRKISLPLPFSTYKILSSGGGFKPYHRLL